MWFTDLYESRCESCKKPYLNTECPFFQVIQVKKFSEKTFYVGSKNVFSENILGLDLKYFLEKHFESDN